MEKKKDFTIEELEKSYQEHKAETDAIKKKIEEMKQEEEDRKKAQLALEKETRKKELEDAMEFARTLLTAYIKDYGSYSGKYGVDSYGLFSQRPISWWF